MNRNERDRLEIRFRELSLLPSCSFLSSLNELLQVAPKIKEKMMEEGSTMIGYQPLGDKVNFFRCVFSNPATQRQDVDFLVEEIARLGCEL